MRYVMIYLKPSVEDLTLIYDLNYCEVQVIQNLLHTDCSNTCMQRLDRAYRFARLISPHKRRLIHDYLEGWGNVQDGIIEIINYVLAGQINVVLNKIRQLYD